MRARRHVAWLSRHSRRVLVACGLLVAASVYLAAFHLPLQADFSALLPADAPAVKAAAKLADRAPARDTMLVVVRAPDPATRAAAARVALDGVATIDRELIAYVEADDDHQDLSKALGSEIPGKPISLLKEFGYTLLGELARDPAIVGPILISAPGGSIEPFIENIPVVQAIAAEAGRKTFVVWPMEKTKDSFLHLQDVIDMVGQLADRRLR